MSGRGKVNGYQALLIIEFDKFTYEAVKVLSAWRRMSRRRRYGYYKLYKKPDKG
jgi:hypothetical protein